MRDNKNQSGRDREPHQTPPPSAAAELTYRKMGWKGIDSDEQPDATPAVQFSQPLTSSGDVDMTPMVDVTFLLLIFFMVTASFTFQRSIEQPVSLTDQRGPISDPQPENDCVQISVDQSNTFYLTTRDAMEQECPSDNEMRARLKDAMERDTSDRLIILAHVNSDHSKVVTAWDAGLDNQVAKIELQTTEEDF